MPAMDDKLKEVIKAVQKDNLDLVKKLLDACDNADDPKEEESCTRKLVNSLCRTSGDSLCHIAAQHGYVDILRYLVEVKGAVVDIRNRDRKTPLHNAAQFSQVPCIEYLISKGADVNAIKQADWTPLMLACTKQNTEAVALLLSAGADPFLRNKDGWNSFHIACRTGTLPIIGMLVHHVPSNLVHLLCDSKSRNGRKPIHTAALHGNTEVVKYILDMRLNYVNEIDNCGSTPLMDACRSGNTEVVDAIITYGGDMWATNKVGYNCLHVAAEAGATKILQHLVKRYNMPLDTPSAETGLTPLQVAEKEKQVDASITLKILQSNEDDTVTSK